MIPKMISTLRGTPRRIVIWFQCPWAYIQELKYNTASLLSRFIKSGNNLNLSLQVDELVLVLGLVDG